MWKVTASALVARVPRPDRAWEGAYLRYSLWSIASYLTVGKLYRLLPTFMFAVDKRYLVFTYVHLLIRLQAPLFDAQHPVNFPPFRTRLDSVIGINVVVTLHIPMGQQQATLVHAHAGNLGVGERPSTLTPTRSLESCLALSILRPMPKPPPVWSAVESIRPRGSSNNSNGSTPPGTTLQAAFPRFLNHAQARSRGSVSLLAFHFANALRPDP
ncbi:hypothetical protein BJ322DRAFT_1016772 [Thelephora terrestris]|uniref:Uncharacterized protein n=1 Tax=Thelephora terrestris TaxID=56493 RepID=A0A9P6LD45_9AGAM|nr:hypothetical protein BJ322DRAFT_1016772 [Thelephora terrestris]